MSDTTISPSELETALEGYQEITLQSLEEDLVRRGPHVWPRLGVLERVLADDIDDRYMDEPVAVEARHPEINVEIKPIVINGLRLAKRVDQLARFQTLPQGLLPPLVTNIERMKLYTASLFAELEDFADRRPRSAKLADSFAPRVVALVNGVYQGPAWKVNPREKLLRKLYTQSMEIGFIAMERVQVAEASQSL